MKKIISLVVSSYGKIEAGALIDLTHDEDPWINSVKCGIISTDEIKDYFNKVYDN